VLSVYIKPIERIAVMSHRNIEVQEKKNDKEFEIDLFHWWTSPGI